MAADTAIEHFTEATLNITMNVHNFFLAATLSALIATYACSPQKAESRQDKDSTSFEMLLRLWPHHHLDSTLSNQLIDALKQYPGLFDEAWLCMSDDKAVLTDSVLEHSSDKMAQMAQRLREISVTPSIQGITLGHSDTFSGWNPELTPWGTMVGPDGARSSSIACPRQKAFQEYKAKEYALYAKKVKPNIIWLDDDLRLTYHTLPFACFCDTCIAEFNRENESDWTRESLVAALEENADGGELRSKWIRFGQESMAEVARAISHSVHEVSPDMRMGLQNTAFHRSLLEGKDWNPILKAMEEETGKAPASRPGNGFYNDHEPRGMINKAYDMARQIRRLDPDVKIIASEIEGYMHASAGKSYQGLCVESMLYLAMGCTQLSYSIIASAAEPMEWYASHYFKHLKEYRPSYEEYATFNEGTEPRGIDPFISRTVAMRTGSRGGSLFSWAYCNAGDFAASLAPYGIPFCPDGNHPTGYMMDDISVNTLSDEEIGHMLTKGAYLTRSGWEAAKQRGIDRHYSLTEAPEGISGAVFFVSDKGGRLAVVDDINTLMVSNAKRLEVLRICDWISEGKLPVIIETAAQMVAVPRVDSEGNLRSVTLLNCSIADWDPVEIRLRGCYDKSSFVWKEPLKKDVTLKAMKDGSDVILSVPGIAGWHIGWIAIR